MTTRILLAAALLVPPACVVADDLDDRDAELIHAELVTGEADDDLDLATVHRVVEDDDDPSCDADLTMVDPGEHNAYFEVVSPQQIDLDPELDFTIDPDGTTLFADNGNGGITMTCRCEDMCSSGSSACQVSADAHEATCTGSCNKSDGGACGVCAWHYGDTPAPRDPLPGPKPTKPALPGGGQNALP